MNSFSKTLVYGFAALGALLVGALVSLLVMLLMNDQLDAKALRGLVLSTEEREWLIAMRKRAEEPPPEKRHETASAGLNEEELVAHIAEVANANHASRLVTKLKTQQQALDERQAWIDQQWSDLQLAKAGFERMQRQLQDQDRKLSEQAKQQEQERAKWASTQAAVINQVTAIGEVEKARYKDQAKLFEQMKDNAWDSLKRFSPREIARYLSLMSDKKAARMLVLAQQDQETPGIAVAIHQEMLRLDPNQNTSDHIDRLATLYAFMPASQVLPYLKDSSAQDVADLMRAMAAKGQLKKRAELMEALRQEDGKREMDVRRLLELTEPAGAVAGPKS